MRTPIGRISWASLLLVLVVVALIVTGMIVPGRTGTIIQVVGWIAFVAGVLLEVGVRTTPIGRFDGNDHRFPFR
jgi:membrane-bound ClpP family serine protease